MNPVKEQAIELIRSLSDDCTLEDIQYHLYVREKVERGIKEADKGNFIKQHEAEKRVKQWLESSGQNQQ